jgi:intracellular septation protein A
MTPSHPDRTEGEPAFSLRMGPIVWQLLPGMVFPGIIYFVVSRSAPVVLSLAAASSVPLLDALVRVVRRRPPNAATALFVLGTGVSIALAVWSGSGMFILAKGAVISALLGLAFALSAIVGRPLTRTLALRLTAPHAEGRRRLAERWGRPGTASVFRVLSAGWGVLLLVEAAQQATMALTLAPGTVMTLEGPVHLFGTALGVGASLLYVRRRQQSDPSVQLLPARAR